MIRRATESDLPAVAGIYDRIHAAESAGELTTGWLKDVYPTGATAMAAIRAGDMFVLEDGGRVVASARVNREQVDCYNKVPWRFPARDDEVMVLHTLTVDPPCFGRGYARRFLAFYEDYALKNGCPELRIDTNAKNAVARAMYARHGYVERAVVPTVFNGIPNVMLVCMEKRLD